MQTHISRTCAHVKTFPTPSPCSPAQRGRGHLPQHSFIIHLGPIRYCHSTFPAAQYSRRQRTTPHFKASDFTLAPVCVMSFRKRGVVLGNPRAPVVAKVEKTLPTGTRPSPHDGRLTTSTGTQSLDQLLAGHAGLPMGTSLLIEETGTTDFGGMLLRYYVAEGLVQGHHVHVLGLDDSWRRELPGLGSDTKDKPTKSASSSDRKMKIAWRYETLGNRVAPSRGKRIILVSQELMMLIHNRTLAACIAGAKLSGYLLPHFQPDKEAREQRHYGPTFRLTDWRPICTTHAIFQNFHCFHQRQASQHPAI